MASTPATTGTSAAPAMPGERVNSERLLLWTLLVVYIFNFLDRQIVTILAESIKRDLGLSDTQLGLLTAARHIYAQAGFTLTSSEAKRSFGQDVVSEHWDLAL